MTSLDGFDLAYDITGPDDAEAVLLIHGGLIADTFAPMATEPALRAFRVIRYHRRGYGDSGCPAGIADPREQAADALALLDAVDVEIAHVVGHSAGGAVALQLAIDAPERVHSLSLLEPYLVNFLPGALDQFLGALAPVLERYEAGDLDGALDHFQRLVFGGRGRPIVETAIPGGIAQAKRDFATVANTEMPGLLGWQINEEEIARVTCPVLTVLGAETDASFQAAVPGFTLMGDTRDLILRWYPHAHDVVLTRLNHLLMIEDPRAVADVLAHFFASAIVATTS